MPLFDTHCHIHEAVRKTTPVYDKWHAKGPVDVEAMLRAAHENSVERMMCVGTTLADSALAVEFVQARDDLWASIGIHPHEAQDHRSAETQAAFAALVQRPKVVAIGECGLDYFYNHSPKADQLVLLRFQIELALQANLPLIFHVREAFDDFWPIFDEYPGVRGVLHSFTDSIENMQRAIDKGLYIGVNGIATFSKQPAQLAMYRAIPLERLCLETDAPFLTPTPFRGTICEPKHVRWTAEFLSNLRDEPLDELVKSTTANANLFFGV